MKVRTWNNIFKGFLITSLFYLIMSIVPPTILFGVFAGIGCSVFNLAMIAYTRYLIRHGKGDEVRPKWTT